MKTADNSKMGEDFFEYLPSEILVGILSRLPTRAAIVCKFVCKSWKRLLATPEFVNSHISRSVPGIAVVTDSKSYEIIEFVDEHGLNFHEKDGWDVAFNFKLPFDEPMHTSANGLIFLSGIDHDDLILCNPITRDYIKLPCPRQSSSKDRIDMETFGFGVSRMTGQYKVVRIFVETPLREGHKNECQVYTIGTGWWRKVPFDSPLWLCEDNDGLHLNGNLHWWVKKSAEGFDAWISCFDLETELFSTFSEPPPPDTDNRFGRSLSILRDSLCVSDVSVDGRIAIWLMNEEEKCWRKEFIIPQLDRLDDLLHVYPIRVFENGDALMVWQDGTPFYYYKKMDYFTYEITFGEDCDFCISSTMYASSFLSLKNFVIENVSSF